MSRSLHLLPFVPTVLDGGIRGESNTILGVPDHEDLRSAICSMSSTEFRPDDHVWCLRATGHREDVAQDFDGNTGKPLRWVYAHHLVLAFVRHLPGDPLTAYVSEMPPSGAFVLDWF